VLVDFHTHTTASDGALTPRALLERAQSLQVSALAITDHDTVAGYLAVRHEVPDGLTLYPGTELSCVWGGANIHIVGVGFDPEHVSLTAMLSRLDEARVERAGKIAQRLERAGMPGALAGACRIAGASQIGRPHFAAWLVEQGFVDDAPTAFDRWLGRGKMGDVKAFWPPLAEVVVALVEAGGVAVLAHPLKYDMTATKLRALCKDFVAAGGQAVEIVSGRQSADERARLSRLAAELNLAVSVGSDFHREWTYGADLGVDTSTVSAGNGVWELLQ
jgi:predicted metal-dependent phosphoesterase TrpH